MEIARIYVCVSAPRNLGSHQQQHLSGWCVGVRVCIKNMKQFLHLRRTREKRSVMSCAAGWKAIEKYSHGIYSHAVCMSLRAETREFSSVFLSFSLMLQSARMIVDVYKMNF